MHLYVATHPRALYLVTDSHDERLGYPPRALVFRQGERHDQAVAEFLPKRQVDLSQTVKITNRAVKGCIGLISVDHDIFLALVTAATDIGNTRPLAASPESIARIHDVSFYSLTSAAWDDFGAAPTGDLSSSPEYSDLAPSGNLNQFEHPCTSLTKLMSNGSFYYAADSQWDVTTRLSNRLSKDAAHTAFDERFIWNEYIVRGLLDFRQRLSDSERDDLDRCHFIILVIQGYVGINTMALPMPPTDGKPALATLALISRLGSKRAGTRFNTRGVDDDGNCANFVETEVLFSTDQHCVSYVQVRGSVPLFWEQQGFQTFGQKIQITRPHASQPAFERHFAHLTEEFGGVHVVNLLGTKENEAILTSAYAHHLQAARSVFGETLGITHFDFHNAVRVGGHDSVVTQLRRSTAVVNHVDQYGYTIVDGTNNDLITSQKGIFRTNCLDCLDRTNFVQDIISRLALESYVLSAHRHWLHSAALWGFHRELWAENGDALSKIYAGTGALNTSFTRTGKRTLAGVLSDATKSVSRAYINNFQDKAKQIAIDMLLGNMSLQTAVSIYDPIHDSVREELERRLPEYSTTKESTIFVGTWNLNGRPPSESLLPWLFPQASSATEPDVFVLGFQEIVPLTAQQIVQTDPEKRRLWETRILETLERRPNKKNSYVLLRSEQLVGTALLVLVKKDLTFVIRNVEATTRKTGLRGMSGNKGGVGIRLQYHDTTFCFLTAHLAAGHSNVEERNIDYRTINRELHFLKGKTILSHDNIIWAADTNYRINSDNDTVRPLAQSDDYDSLLAMDQLKQVMDANIAFGDYTEGPILFRPTYRFDVGTTNYDTSEKLRIPAWTDRILYRGHDLDLNVYTSVDLKGSDHKPVLAIFRAHVRIIDIAKRAEIAEMLLNNVTATAPGEKLDDKLASLGGSQDHDKRLPAPSSEDSLWWDVPDLPHGVLSVEQFRGLSSGTQKVNPFDASESPLSASPSSSDDELFKHALSLPAPLVPTKKPPPPPPPLRVSHSES